MVGKNVIVIVCDSLRADFLEKELQNLPNLKKLVEKGIFFTRAYSSSCWTKPAVVSFFTGLSVSKHGVKSYLDSLNPNRKTLSEILKEKGYFNILVTENPFIEKAGINKGFNIDVTFSDKPKFLFKFFYKLTKKINLPISNYFFFKAYEEIIPAKKLFKKAIESIKKKDKSKPFFCYIHLMDTHYPYRINFKERKKLNEAKKNKDKNALSKFIKKSIKEVDADLEQLLTYVEKNFENNLIIFLADHGDMLFEHGKYGHGNKKGLYEEVIKIPLIIANNNLTNSNKIVDAPVSMIDIFPTVLNSCNLKFKQDLEGISLLEAIDLKNAINREIIVESGIDNVLRKKGENQIAVIRGKWKYVLHSDTKKQELFDLFQDPKEKNNILNKNEKIAEKLKVSVEKLLGVKSDKINEEKFDSEIIERLEGLGYI